MTAVGLEPTNANISELESDPLDHSGILSHLHPMRGLNPRPQD